MHLVKILYITTQLGSYNAAIGDHALLNNITGSFNTALGRNAGYNATGSGNVFIGYKSWVRPN